MSKTELVLMLGRNTGNIYKEAAELFPADKVTIVCREGDKLENPVPGATMVVAAQFATDSPEVIVVANGGTTSQLVHVLHYLYLSLDKRVFKVVDLQRDGMSIMVEHQTYDPGPDCRWAGECPDRD